MTRSSRRARKSRWSWSSRRSSCRPRRSKTSSSSPCESDPASVSSSQPTTSSKHARDPPNAPASGEETSSPWLGEGPAAVRAVERTVGPRPCLAVLARTGTQVRSRVAGLRGVRDRRAAGSGDRVAGPTPVIAGSPAAILAPRTGASPRCDGYWDRPRRRSRGCDSRHRWPTPACEPGPGSRRTVPAGRNRHRLDGRDHGDLARPMSVFVSASLIAATAVAIGRCPTPAGLVLAAR